MRKKINQSAWFLLFLCSFSYGQMKNYDFKRELNGISEQWHQINLPDDVFAKVSQNLEDFRIFGITEANDTIESPFLIRRVKERIKTKDVAFTMLNTSYNKQGYFFTFQNTSIAPVNQIKLTFKQQNFDWRLQLEGSQNQQEWFSITKNYRILSIKNGMTNFKFTTLKFPSAKFRYFRLRVNSEENPELLDAKVEQREITKVKYRNFPIQEMDRKENKTSKQTEITIKLPKAVPVSHIHINVADTFDYYRPITIKYLRDSIQTEKGFRYNYKTLTTGTLNSINKNEFEFDATTLQKLKIVVQNQDNQALNLEGIKVKGYTHLLVARFTEPANYYLAYGNRNAKKPNYDIAQFKNKIPETLVNLNLGSEQSIEKPIFLKQDPLFENKNWLWLVMAIIIGLLAWFSLKMMRKQ